MHWDWQLAIVLAAVGWAAFVVCRRVRRLLQAKSGGCSSGDCGGCGSQSSKPLVSLTLAPPTAAEPRQKLG